MTNQLAIQIMNEAIDELDAEESQELELQETSNEGLKVGTRKNGRAYTVRENRKRFFSPKEWKKFYYGLKTEQQRICFETLLNTGARVNEVLHIKVCDISFEKGLLILRVTKIKAKKGQTKSEPRTIKISAHLCCRLIKWCKNKDKSEYLGFMTASGINACLKRTLKEVGIEDWYMFSIHNIRKTTGNWLKALGMDGLEICQRLGHDMNTFLSAYGSPDIFNKDDKVEISELLGNITLWGDNKNKETK